MGTDVASDPDVIPATGLFLKNMSIPARHHAPDNSIA
jgi:hypothetical protein